MSRSLVIDSHCDTIKEALDEKLSITDFKYSFNLREVKEKLPYIQFLASFAEPKYENEENGGFKRVNQILDKFYFEYDKYSDYITIIRKEHNLKDVVANNKLGVILTVENGSAISGNLDNIDLLYNRGIRIMSVTWNKDNKLGCGAETDNDTGLTELGRKYVERLNKKNILIDVSHLSKNSFFDVINLSNKPVVATHSCADKLCTHHRNLTDEQIKEIARIKGVIGVCFYSKFLTKNIVATAEDIVNHIEYIANLVGIEYVGLGSDFDGVCKKDLPVDVKGVKDIDIIFDKMRKRGFSESDILKVSSSNYIRILKNNIF